MRLFLHIVGVILKNILSPKLATNVSWSGHGFTFVARLSDRMSTVISDNRNAGRSKYRYTENITESNVDR